MECQAGLLVAILTYKRILDTKCQRTSHCSSDIMLKYLIYSVGERFLDVFIFAPRIADRGVAQLLCHILDP